MAAVWLLAPQLARSHRFITFLCLAPTLAGFSFRFLMKQDWSCDDTPWRSNAESAGHQRSRHFAGGDSGGLVAGAVIVPSDFMCGFSSCWPLWLVIAAPFFLIALVASGGGCRGQNSLFSVLAVAPSIWHVAAVSDFVVGQPVLPRTAQGVAARKTGGPADIGRCRAR